MGHHVQKNNGKEELRFSLKVLENKNIIKGSQHCGLHNWSHKIFITS